MHSQLTMLAPDMHDEPLSVDHGAPLQFRNKIELGFKNEKWISTSEVVADSPTSAAVTAATARTTSPLASDSLSDLPAAIGTSIPPSTGAIMNGAQQTNSEFEALRAQHASLKNEHALLMREVRTRAQAVTSEADNGDWPQTPLRELLNYLHLEILRQLVDEEWLLFRVVRHVPDVVSRLRRDHLELRLTIELLDQAAATAGSAAGLSSGQLSAITTDLLDQLEKHLAAEGELSIGGEYAPATASFGAQPHEWYALTERSTIDLDQLPGAQGADAALARLMRLEANELVVIGSSSDLGPPCQRLTAVDPGGYGITYLERGPDRWRVKITRRTESPPPSPYV